MERLKVLREQRGFSREILAADADVSPVTLWRYETGKRSPNVETLEKLAKVLDVEVADFFPKAEPSLFDAAERRRPEKYLPWLEFALRYEDRWVEKAKRGDLDETAIREWKATLQDLGKTVLRLREEEERGLSPERILELEDELIMRKVGASFMGPLTSILDAHQALLDEDELARFRRERETVERDLDLAVNG
ncbi:MAG: helix-turn-helix domain-containing protein [Rubrobacteraceae bacterium]